MAAWGIGLVFSWKSQFAKSKKIELGGVKDTEDRYHRRGHGEAAGRGGIIADQVPETANSKRWDKRKHMP